MTTTTRRRDDAALSAAYEQEVGRMYEVLVDALVQDNADVETACQRFKRGVAIARNALDLATQIVSE